GIGQLRDLVIEGVEEMPRRDVNPQTSVATAETNQIRHLVKEAHPSTQERLQSIPPLDDQQVTVCLTLQRFVVREDWPKRRRRHLIARCLVVTNEAASRIKA